MNQSILENFVRKNQTKHRVDDFSEETCKIHR